MQIVQLEAPALEVDPVGQLVHEVAEPPEEYVPAGQLTQLPLLRYFPAEQVVTDGVPESVLDPEELDPEEEAQLPML